MARIEYERLSGITYEQELEILSEVYRLALESYRKRKQKSAEPAPEPDGRDDTPSVRNAEGVSHVDQQPD
jgi:hypothetical protein